MENLVSIQEVNGIKFGNTHGLNGGNGSRLGMAQMINGLCGYAQYAGYKVVTNENEYLILIDDGQSCCENWGYIVSNDDFDNFVGKEVSDVRLTDTQLNNSSVYDELKYLDCGGVQFVDFKFTDGDTLQFAVYNAHNGYYGHGIVITKNNEILLNDVL